MSLTVKELIKELKKMPQNAQVGFALHDYDTGDSENVNSVTVVNDEDCTNDTGKAMHRVVLNT
ncbi:hypothetical protein [Pseudoalteromonas sp. MEBiC 03485]|uniref:hypothetical protein n=1 Tax=Pseudoalteromonas sp. MEBiC 03485 TaxID=2571103 RepID=UPI001021B11B|nr:hypothetical protein [Pseudoalteromonas sp. MEBiC 03485]RZD19695.1 hypothetical protein EVU92_21065 [Pseudoalteromonas sp. MEBiC 03485]